MKNLKQLEKELGEAEAVVAKNPEDIPSAVYGAWMTRIAQTRDSLKTLRAEYRQTFQSCALAVFVSGSPEKVAEFLAVAAAAGNEGIAVSASALYERLATGVEEGLAGRREWGIQQTYRLHSGLMEVMEEVGLTEMQMPDRATSPILPTHADVVSHVRQVVREAVGDELNSLYVEHLAVQKALEIRYIGVAVPVLVTDAREDERVGVARRFAKGSATVVVPETETVDEAFLVKAFKDVGKQLKKKGQ